MDYEIDFLPVGDMSKGGDAICLRFGDLCGDRNEQVIVVIDGGYEPNGPKILEHLEDYYSAEGRIDVVLNTHPDNDHTYGLKHVLEHYEVGELWMHRPEVHSADFASPEAFVAAFRSRMTLAQSDLHRFERTKNGLTRIQEIQAIATEKSIPIVEPFPGATIELNSASFRIIGPSVDYYESLLGEFGYRSPTAANRQASAAKDEPPETLAESLTEETLTDDGNVSAKNNSSAISLLTVNGQHALLTGDAGADALGRALDHLGDEFGTGMFSFVQVPHHGSRRNVGPTILDRLLGEKGTEEKRGTAFVSSPKLNPDAKHPAKKVTNAFLRRGYPVHATSSRKKHHYSLGAPRRDWGKSTALPLFEQVEVDGGDSPAG